MEKQQKAILAAQDTLVRQINEPVVTLTSKLEGFHNLLDHTLP